MGSNKKSSVGACKSYCMNLFYEHYFCKGLFFVNFELLVVFCHGLSKGEFVRF